MHLSLRLFHAFPSQDLAFACHDLFQDRLCEGFVGRSVLYLERSRTVEAVGCSSLNARSHRASLRKCYLTATFDYRLS